MAVRMAHRPTSWRTVFVSPTLPTLLMLPGVIVVVALPARVRANPASGTRPSSAARPGRIPVHPMRELCVRRSAASCVRRLEGEARA